MAILTFKNDKTKIVDYNTAAKVYQIQQGNIVKDKDLAKLKVLAEKTINIDFKRLR